VTLVKPFRALRYDTAAVGPLDALVAPPYDVIPEESLGRLAATNPYNIVRLIRPQEPELAARRFRAWQAEGVLVREARPAVWRLEEEFVGPDGVPRIRSGLVARVRVEPFERGLVLPHERTFAGPTESRLGLIRALRAKLSPVLLLHQGPPPPPPPDRPADLAATLEGTTSRLWRVDAAGAEALTAQVMAPLVIADGHHRYTAALRYHVERGDEASAYVLAVLVSRDDAGLEIFPSHRLAAAVPELDGARTCEVPAEPGAALARLGAVGRDHPAFVLLTRGHAVLAETDPVGEGPLGRLDVSALETLTLTGVSYTASAAEAAVAVETGAAAAALLVRAPTVAEVDEVARAGLVMPQKSTYFFPKLTSGLLISPLDE
jgi:uncharacterized protein (DUF1015 family)